VTEQEWLSINDPAYRLAVQYHLGLGRPFDRTRKAHLLVCACARRIWPLLRDERSRRAVEVAERAVEGWVSAKEFYSALGAALEPIEASLTTDPGPQPRFWRHGQGLHPVGPDPIQWEDYAEVYVSDAAAAAASQVLAFPPKATSGWPTDPLDPMVDAVADWGDKGDDPATRAVLMDAERQAQCALLLDIFGNPFRPMTLDPAWQTPEVVTLAGHIYHDWAFAELPELAEALESAGCADQTVLAHCRESGPHVRGCWVVDLLLARE
jgi:hypothetical protein